MIGGSVWDRLGRGPFCGSDFSGLGLSCPPSGLRFLSCERTGPNASLWCLLGTACQGPSSLQEHPGVFCRCVPAPPSTFLLHRPLAHPAEGPLERLGPGLGPGGPEGPSSLGR